MATSTDHSPLRKSALAALRSGRVAVIYSRTDAADYLRVVKVVARVASSRQGGGHYGVDLDSGEWRCTCGRHRGPAGEPCAHIHAVQLVTTGVAA